MANNLKLIEEAKNCNNCLCWHKHCNAECCRQFRIPINALKKNRLGLSVRTTLSDDEQWYYKIHGCYYLKKELVMSDKEGFRKEVKDGFVIFHRDCDYLKGNLCIAHEKGLKPELCKGFNELTGENKAGESYPTPNCLCNFKQPK